MYTKFKFEIVFFFVFGETKYKQISWLVSSKWYIITFRYFENFNDKCIGIYELDRAHFLSACRLAWEACLKNIEIKLELLI